MVDTSDNKRKKTVIPCRKKMSLEYIGGSRRLYLMQPQLCTYIVSLEIKIVRSHEYISFNDFKL